MQYLELDPNQRYVPVCRRNGKPVLPVGIVVLADANPEAPEDVSKGYCCVCLFYCICVYLTLSFYSVERITLGQEVEADPPLSFVWIDTSP